MSIEGPEVCGRWIAQKNYLWEEGGMREYRNRGGIERYSGGIENLPKLFRRGGYVAQRKRCSEEEMRAAAVMNLVSAHGARVRAPQSASTVGSNT